MVHEEGESSKQDAERGETVGRSFQAICLLVWRMFAMDDHQSSPAALSSLDHIRLAEAERKIVTACEASECTDHFWLKLVKRSLGRKRKMD